LYDTLIEAKEEDAQFSAMSFLFPLMLCLYIASAILNAISTAFPADPILGVSVAFNKDQHPDKINLGVGAYRTEVTHRDLELFNGGVIHSLVFSHGITYPFLSRYL
jgi:hypothetical protein